MAPTPPKIEDDDSFSSYLQLSVTTVLVAASLQLSISLDVFIEWMRRMIGTTIYVCVLHYVWYLIDFHKHFGPWKCSEPKGHMMFAMKTAWIVALFTLGNSVLNVMYGVDPSLKLSPGKFVLWELPKEYQVISSTSLASDIFWGVLGFYAIDFLRYWGHRIGHYAFFYKTFPFSHAHHHNQVFVQPATTLMSPMLHLASVATYTPTFILGIMGLHRASIICWSICILPNVTQHLGFDPFPWLTRLNHYYFYGALPWIPLYHSYHHNPFIKTGNFGNTTVLFDYVYGTVQPECVYHIENGKPLEKVAERFADGEKLDKILNSMYTAGKGKNRPDLNDAYDGTIFKMHVM